MPIERIRRPAGLSQPGLYAHVVKAGNTVYIAGQVAMDEQGATVGKGAHFGTLAMIRKR